MVTELLMESTLMAQSMEPYMINIGTDLQNVIK